MLGNKQGTPDSHELARQFAILEERMKTMQAEYKTDIALLAQQMGQQMADIKTDMARRDTEAAKRDTEAAKRETRLLLAVAGLISFGIVILGILIRLSSN